MREIRYDVESMERGVSYIGNGRDKDFIKQL
jgi:hypothetical protein